MKEKNIRKKGRTITKRSRSERGLINRSVHPTKKKKPKMKKKRKREREKGVQRSENLEKKQGIKKTKKKGVEEGICTRESVFSPKKIGRWKGVTKKKKKETSGGIEPRL